MTARIQKALDDLNRVTDLTSDEGTFMEFMAEHEGTLRQALEAALSTPAPCEWRDVPMQMKMVLSDYKRDPAKYQSEMAQTAAMWIESMPPSPAKREG